MNSRSGFSVSKPVAVWNKYKSIKADFKELFKSLGKAAIDGVLGKWDSVATDFVDVAASLGFAETPEEIAWVLIYRSLIQAMLSLVEGNQELIVKKPNLTDLGVICNFRLDLSLENMELRIDQDFFQNPKQLPILEAIKTPFAQWLEGFGVTPAQAETIVHRLPTYFVFALHEEWAKHPDKYACLKEELDTPFTQANEREQAWQRYGAWLQKQVEEPIFLEAFGLKQVYVPLRAYYEKRKEQGQDNQIERIVVDLETELQAWLDEANRTDAIRVISGGPGSGKSSFSKMFAAKQAERGKVPVLFIPLHLFDPKDDLVNGVGKFIKLMRSIPLPVNPLEESNTVSRLLVIFDGLDELAMQGKIAEEVAQEFVNEVQKQVIGFNSSQTCLQVLISGRELVVQKNQSEFRKPKQILHILSYFVTQEEIREKNYIDEHKFLQVDQRQRWWQSYGKASGRGYTGLPTELDQGHLREITSQPLLNYLVALSYIRGELIFSEDSNLNEIYADLLKQVYQRVWADENLAIKNPVLKGIEEEDFIRILEAIAVAAWHGGDGRTTTVIEIEKHCDSDILQRVLEIFKQDKKAGITRLLTAFYFRQTGFREREETFEFTHKSFGEYLTARRIVWELKRLYEMQEVSKNNRYVSWNEKEALKNWAILCGPNKMNEYLFNFLVDEMRLQDKSQVGKWQQMLCHLFSFMLRDGMPMEELKLPNFNEEYRQACNAEEALLAVLNACARATKNLSQIKWHYSVIKTSEKTYFKDFGAWISRLHRQRVDFDKDVFCLKCLSFLDLQNCILILKDFYKANLEGANLGQANLERAYLVGANLEWANLEGANLEGANLEGANLEGAYLVGANLEWASLEGASLEGANLVGANLVGANLVRAKLVRAYLVGANLEQAYLVGANLEWTNLEGANLEGANLEGANLEGANLEGAYLGGAYLGGANLERANLERANLEWANLERAKLEWTNLEGAILADANFKGTILESKD